MRYDEERQTLELSVRELAFGEQERAFAALPFARLRAELGRVVHRRYQRELAPGESEVPLRLEREIDGVRCRVRGRADVVRSEDGVCVVEEIKSVFDVSEEEGERPEASFQVQLYALALTEEGEAVVRPRIVLVELESDRQRTLELGFDPRDVERRLDEALRRCLTLARAQAERARARREAAEAIRFPFAELRPGQVELLEAVGEALGRGRPVMLSAPTGTGKTVVAMVPALREALRRGASLWVVTAKTTQRQLAADTFAAIVRASKTPRLRAVITRRKEAMCPPGHLRCHPALCPLLADFRERCPEVVAELGREVVVGPELLLRRGRAAQLCPYELMHALIDGADLVVADYSHVYDPRRSRAFEGRRLVVVDEAHNLVDRAREQASAFVARSLPALEVADLLTNELATLRREAIDAIDDALAQAAEEERPAHEGQATTELDAARWQELGLGAGVLALRYAHARYRREEMDPRDPVLESLEEIAYLGELCGDPDPALSGYLASVEASGGAGVGVLCLDPARRLERHHRRLEGVVMMSATLDPLDYFADVLGLARLEPRMIRAPSPFVADNRLVCIVPTVRTTFEERDEHAGAIARHIAEVVAARPGNYAAFFPSFRFLATVSRHLDPRALVGHALLTQLPGTSEAVRARVLEQLGRADTPTLLLAVTGGVFAEGVDLPADALIGAIVVGPALPAATFERRLMQAYYQERYEAGFAYAMAYPAMQRVIQAAGRVHRTPEDRGVIVLLGARFCEPPYCEALPGHWYDHAPEELVTHDLADRLRRFWQLLDG